MIKIESKHTLFHGTERARVLGVDKISQGLPAGANLTRPANSYSFATGWDDTHGYMNYPVIMHVTYLPTLGGGAGEWYASEAFLKMYNAMCGSAYTTTTFSRADLQMHIMAGEGFLTALDMIDRMLDLYSITEYENLGVRNLYKACGFSNTLNSMEFPTLVAARNRLVTKYNKLLIPSNIPALDRHRQLCRHIYADDIHDKTQFIIFRPYCCYTFISNNGTDLVPSSAWTSVHGMNQYLSTFISAIEADLDRYLQSAFFEEISPYLWRSMVDPHGPQIAKVYVVEQYDLALPSTDYVFIHDSEVCQMVRNANFVGRLVNFNNNHSGNLSHINFHEDNDGVLRQGYLGITSNSGIDGLAVTPVAAAYSDSITAVLYPENIDAFDLFNNNVITKAVWPFPVGDRYLNLEDFPSSTDTIFTALGGQVFAQKINSSSKNLYNIRACGDVLYLWFSYFYTDPTKVGSVSENSLIESPDMINYCTLTANSSPNRFSSLVTYLPNNYVIRAALFSYFSSPITHTIETDWDDIWESPIIIDVDNIVAVPYATLVTYWTYDAYDRFSMASTYNRSEDKSIKSKNNKRYKKVSKKPINKSDSKGKSNSKDEGKDVVK